MLKYQREINLIRDLCARRGETMSTSGVKINEHNCSSPSAKPQQARYLHEGLAIVATGEIASASGVKRLARGWNRTGFISRKHDGYRVRVVFKRDLQFTSLPAVEVWMSGGTRNHDMEALIDLHYIPDEVFDVGLEIVGEGICLVDAKEMGCMGMPRAMAIINFCRKNSMLCPIKFKVMAFKLQRLGNLPGDNISDIALKSKFLACVFHDPSSRVEAVEVKSFMVNELGRVCMDGRLVCQNYKQFPEHFMAEADRLGIEGYVVGFDHSWLFKDSFSFNPSKKDFRGVDRLKNLFKCKRGFRLSLYVVKEADGYSLFASLTGERLMKLDPYIQLESVNERTGGRLFYVQCTWIKVKYSDPVNLMRPQKKDMDVESISLLGIHEIMNEDACPPGTAATDIATATQYNRHYQAIMDAIYLANQMGLKVGFLSTSGSILGTRLLEGKRLSINQEFSGVWTLYPFKNEQKIENAWRGPKMVKFGSDATAEPACPDLACPCGKDSRVHDKAKMETILSSCSVFVWPAGYELDDATPRHVEGIILELGASLYDPASAGCCNYVVVSMEEIVSTKTFAAFYASLASPKPKIVLPSWPCYCKKFETSANLMDRLEVKSSPTPVISDVFELGRPLSLWARAPKKSIEPAPAPTVCKCTAADFKKARKIRYANRSSCILCRLPIVAGQPAPAVKKQRTISAGVFDTYVVKIWKSGMDSGRVEGLEGTVTDNGGTIFTNEPRCDMVFVADIGLAISPDLLAWLARFAIAPWIYLADGIADCVEKKLPVPDASFRVSSRVE